MLLENKTPFARGKDTLGDQYPDDDADITPYYGLYSVAQVKEAFKLSSADFKAKYGKPLPANDQEVIFHCKLGGRAGKAAEEAKSLGFNK